MFSVISVSIQNSREIFLPAASKYCLHNMLYL